ncbi:MAG: cytochrome-c peroxidase, partial [Flavisolibacter sp.]
LSLIIIVAGYSYILQSCKKSDASLPSSGPAKVNFIVPAGFPQTLYNFANNPLTNEGIALGRKLFYDGRLSKDGNFPCSSCHQQFDAFATYAHDLSHGFNNSFTNRNAPALSNLAWQKEFQWDGGVNNLEVQPLAPITASNEMAETIDNVIAKLKADAIYKQMFKSAFGDEDINSQRMLKAITQFTVSLVSANSKYDKVKRGEASFTLQEQNGYTAFQAKCSTCHKEPLFTDLSYRNNGLPLSPFLKDIGRMKITGSGSDSLKFKVPSLRNVAITAPYMHDGRFWFLSQVLEHYQSGITYSQTLDPLLINGIRLNTEDIQNITAFLQTLTDSTFIKDPRFSQPPE